MGIKHFSIEFDGDVYYPREMIFGRVHLSVDEPTKTRGIQLTLYGKAKVHWRELEEECISHDGKEDYFKTVLDLVGGGQKFVLPAGEHVYPFSATIPASSPPTFKSKYGVIEYGGKAKLDLVWTCDEIAEKHFIVKKPIDLNEFSESHRVEMSETFWSWFGDSAPLTATVCISRMGFVRGEAIPITINVVNASNVEIYGVQIELEQIIKWMASSSSKEMKTKMNTRRLDGVGAGASKTWTEALNLSSSTYPNSGDCRIIQIKYELAIKLYPRGLHSKVKIKTPITIGDIPSGALLPDGIPYFEGNSESSSEATGTLRSGRIVLPSALAELPPLMTTNTLYHNITTKCAYNVSSTEAEYEYI